MSIQTVHKQHLVRACVICALKRQIFHAFACKIWTHLRSVSGYFKYEGCSSAASGLLSIVGFPFHCLSSVQLWQYFSFYMGLQRFNNSGKSKNRMIWGRGAFWRRWRRTEMHYFNPVTCFYFPLKHSVLVKTKLKPAAGLGPACALGRCVRKIAQWKYVTSHERAFEYTQVRNTT